MNEKLTISIYRDGVWAGNGYVNRYGEIECSAILGSDQDASDSTYSAMSDGIESGEMSGSIVRPDGEYTWEIKELPQPGFHPRGETDEHEGQQV